MENKRFSVRVEGVSYIKNADGTIMRGDAIDRLAAYEDTGLAPEDVATLTNELATAKEAICQMCRTRGEEQHILCGCATCKYGGGKNGE